jgi:hypothetical protein
MAASPRMLPILLVATIAATLTGMHALGFSPAQSVHSAGCHGSRPPSPSPSPASYLCCMSGHDWAIPGTAFSLRPAAAQFFSEIDALARVGNAYPWKNLPEITVVPFSSPPNSSPRRI